MSGKDYSSHTKQVGKQPKLAPNRAAKVRTTKQPKPLHRGNSIGQASVLACTNWLPAYPVSLAICERTGLSCAWQDDLGQAYMSSYACHPRFLPGAWADLQRQLADRQQVGGLDPRLIAGACLYLLTAPRPGRTPILHHYSTLELSVINTGLAQLGTASVLRLYRIANTVDWGTTALAVSSLSETHGIPLERYASEIAGLILRQQPEVQDRIAEKHQAKVLVRKEAQVRDTQDTVSRKVASGSESETIAAMHRWLQPWTAQQYIWQSYIAQAAERASLPQEIAIWVKRNALAQEAKAQLSRTSSLYRNDAYVRLSESALATLIDKFQYYADQASAVQSWTSQDQQIKYMRCLAVLRKELARKAVLDDTILD